MIMPDAHHLLSKATELAEQGRYEEAFNLLRQGIETDANKAFTTHKKPGRPRVTIDYEKA